MQCSKSVLVAFLVNTWCCADVLPYVTSSPPQEPFDADEYIERLAWRTPGGGSKGGAEAFDPKRYYSILSVICTAHTFLKHEWNSALQAIKSTFPQSKSNIRYERLLHSLSFNTTRKFNFIANMTVASSLFKGAFFGFCCS